MKILSETPEPDKKLNAPDTREKVNSTDIETPLPPKDTKDKPFVADYFDIEGWGQLLLEPKMDAHGLVNKINFIEEYLSNQFKKNSMKNDMDSFKEILKDIEESLGVDDKHEITHRISRVYGFLNVIKLTKEKEDLRRERLISMLKK